MPPHRGARSHQGTRTNADAPRRTPFQPPWCAAWAAPPNSPCSRRPLLALLIYIYGAPAIRASFPSVHSLSHPSFCSRGLLVLPLGHRGRRRWMHGPAP
ncbi:MAG: hypothetical protein ACK55Z_19260 [bacterium]